MKKLFGTLLIFVIGLSVSAQKTYFVYLQTEAEQPFFVRMNDKVYSSTAAGFLILSGMKDSTYMIRVGFPQNKWPEQLFSLEVRGKDRGLLLKNFEGKGWGLFDLLTSSVQMADTGGRDGRSVRVEPRKVSAFTEVLSKAANDPSLKETVIYLKKEEKPAVGTAMVSERVSVKEVAIIEVEPDTTSTEPPPVTGVEDPVSAAAKGQDSLERKAAANVKAGEEKQKVDSAVARIDEPKPKVDTAALLEQPDMGRQDTARKEMVKVEDKKEVKAVVDSFGKSVVRKRAESSTLEGMGITYVDEYADGKTDTVKIVIPEEKKPVVKAPTDNKKFLDISEKKADSTVTPSTLPVNDCKAVITEGEVQRLKKKMSGQVADDGMIDEAKKVFASKCVTVKQLRQLSVLFQNDAARFQFFEAAYRRVSDIGNFAGLDTEFRNEYYLKRFRSIK